ncbi:unnamed protein product, partial [Closterium sp. NIES-53]
MLSLIFRSRFFMSWMCRSLQAADSSMARRVFNSCTSLLSSSRAHSTDTSCLLFLLFPLSPFSPNALPLSANFSGVAVCCFDSSPFTTASSFFTVANSPFTASNSSFTITNSLSLPCTAVASFLSLITTKMCRSSFTSSLCAASSSLTAAST